MAGLAGVAVFGYGAFVVAAAQPLRATRWPYLLLTPFAFLGAWAAVALGLYSTETGAHFKGARAELPLVFGPWAIVLLGYALLLALKAGRLGGTRFRYLFGFLFIVLAFMALLFASVTASIGGSYC